MKFHMRYWGLFTFAIIVATVITGCKQKTATQADKRAKAFADQLAKDKQLFSNPDDAIAELRRRLHQDIHVTDGLVIMNDPTLAAVSHSKLRLDQYVFPANTPWVLSCGLTGIDVVFGNSVSGSTEDVSNDVTLILTYATLDAHTCDKISLQLGKEVEAILSAK